MNELQRSIRNKIIRDFADKPHEVSFHGLIEEVFHHLERDASKRAIAVFLDTLGPAAKERYLYDPVFHNLVDTLAQVFTHAALGNVPLTEAERNERMAQVDLMHTHLTTLDPTDGRADAPDSRTP